MRITLEIDVNLKLDELDDFIASLSEDITDGDTAQEYYITMVGWSWADNHLRDTTEKVKNGVTNRIDKKDLKVGLVTENELEVLKIEEKNLWFENKKSGLVYTMDIEKFCRDFTKKKEE